MGREPKEYVGEGLQQSLLKPFWSVLVERYLFVLHCIAWDDLDCCELCSIIGVFLSLDTLTVPKYFVQG